MSDTSSDSSRQSEQPQGLRIKIGSQREPLGAAAEEPDPTAAQVAGDPASGAPSDAATHEKSDDDVATSDSAVAAATPGAPVGAGDASDASDVESSADAIGLGKASDEDLEREIEASMGAAAIDDLMAGEVQIRPGDVEVELDGRYPATVLQIHRESVMFELPGGQNGVAPLKHFEEPPEPGTTREVVVVGFTDEDQLYNLIVPGASVDVGDWSDLAEGVVVEARITGHNKGGLECEVNSIRGFIPASQASLFRVEDLSQFVDEKLQCVVTEANPERRNLVLSHRSVLERERKEAREKLLSELEVGQTREGVVSRLQKFGAFVDLGGIDGLIHISQMSWDRVAHPSEVLEEGQRVKVRIDRIDETTGKIGFSYRDLLHHPWEGIEAKYPLGSVVAGTVTKLTDFGAFVKLEPGVEGLVHISELSRKRVTRVADVVREGDVIQVKILTIDPSAQRLSLSVKAATAEADAVEESADGEDVETARVAKRSPETLKGGVGRATGGEKFGLNW